MLLDSSLEQGTECLERMRAVLAEASFDHISHGLRITVSIGLTDFHSGDTLDATIERADQAMYRAKQLGRNRVIPAHYQIAEHAIPNPVEIQGRC